MPFCRTVTNLIGAGSALLLLASQALGDDLETRVANLEARVARLEAGALPASDATVYYSCVANCESTYNTCLKSTVVTSTGLTASETTPIDEFQEPSFDGCAKQASFLTANRQKMVGNMQVGMCYGDLDTTSDAVRYYLKVYMFTLVPEITAIAPTQAEYTDMASCIADAQRI